MARQCHPPRLYFIERRELARAAVHVVGMFGRRRVQFTRKISRPDAPKACDEDRLLTSGDIPEHSRISAPASPRLGATHMRGYIALPKLPFNRTRRNRRRMQYALLGPTGCQCVQDLPGLGHVRRGAESA